MEKEVKAIEARDKRLYKKLKAEEGFRDTVYKDSLGKPTVGIGHLLTPEEQKMYPVGTKIPEEQLTRWFKQDSTKAFNAANEQANELGLGDPEFVEALTSVNFQLGTGWTKKFPTAWKHLKNKDYDRAIQEIRYTKEGSGVSSNWYKQTPNRVHKFIKAIKKLKGK